MEKVLTYREYEFIFAFRHIDQWSKEKEDGPGDAPYIKCELHRKDVPDLRWEWNDFLNRNDKIEFHLKYFDGIDVRGSFSLFRSASGQDFVFLDTYLGLLFEDHFEGNVMEVGKHRPVQPAKKEQEESIGQPLIEPADYQDLFPYLYLQNWPALSASDELLFVRYPLLQSSPPAQLLYDALVQLYSGIQAREQMEGEALLFINGSAPYGGEFIHSIHHLPFHLRRYPALYDWLYGATDKRSTSFTDMLASESLEWAELQASGLDSLYEQVIMRVWQNVIALNIIYTYQAYKLEQLVKILVVDHFIRTAAGKEAEHLNGSLQHLVPAAVVLPPEIFPLPAYNTSIGLQAQQTGLYNGSITPYAVGDLQMVQHRLTGYSPGEIARIENVLIGEVKKTKHKNRQVEKESSGITNKRTETHKKQTSGELLEKEVMKTLQGSLADTYDFTNLSTSYGPPTTGTYNGTVNITKNFNSNKQDAVQFARKILAKTIDRISSSVMTNRESSFLHETEEVLTHILDNRKGSAPIRGIYRWLNKVYQLRLVNYGQRFMMEFLISKPSWTPAPAEAPSLPAEPVAPEGLPSPVSSFNDISTDNFVELGAYYQVDELALPPANKLVTGLLNDSDFFSATALSIPDGYVPLLLTIVYRVNQPATLLAGVKYVQLSVQDAATEIPISDPMGLASFSSASPPIAEPGFEGASLSIMIDQGLSASSPPFSAEGSYLNASMLCVPSPDTLNAWKIKIYMAVLQGYQRLQKKYMKQLSQRQPDNGGFNNQLTGTAIRKMVSDACISLLSQSQAQTTGEPPESLSPPQEEVNRPEYLQFFHESFEWQELSFALESQPGSNKPEDLLRSMNDRLYDREAALFLEAKRLRVLVPVKWPYNFSVLYFLASGIMLSLKGPLAPVVEKDTAIAAILLKQTHQPGGQQTKELDHWESIVPTQMQWLQEDNQLPVFHHHK